MLGELKPKGPKGHRRIVMGMHSRGTPHGILLRSKSKLVLVVVLFSVLGFTHALQTNQRDELDRLSEEFAQNNKQIADRVDNLEEKLDQTREFVAESSVLTTRSVETMLWDLRAAKKTLSTQIAALEHRVAAQELESKCATAEVLACSILHDPPVKETFQAATDRI